MVGKSHFGNTGVNGRFHIFDHFSMRMSAKRGMNVVIDDHKGSYTFISWRTAAP
jgi:hypothetical protein